jgi:hypothetical protein
MPSGQYSLAVPDRNSTLVVSFIGYISQELAVGGRSQLDIKLVTDSKSLNEVVVVGYAEQSRAKTTASVTKLDSKELRNIPSASPVQALQGKMAGVSVPVLTGQPGASASIVIRGGTTLNPYGTGSANEWRQGSPEPGRQRPAGHCRWRVPAVQRRQSGRHRVAAGAERCGIDGGLRSQREPTA